MIVIQNLSHFAKLFVNFIHDIMITPTSGIIWTNCHSKLTKFNLLWASIVIESESI